MKIVKVIYTTTTEFTAQNQVNIKTVMADLRNLNAPGINYNACLQADGKTFIHTAFFSNDDDQKILNELPSFKAFQTALKGSGLESPPKQEILTLVDSTTNIFNQ